jgi:putative ABC transport system permease protein
VASLGTAGTLEMNSREQAGAFAVLHALGMQRRGVRRLVLWQALLLAGLALLPGVAAGLGIAFVISRGSGLVVPFAPEVGLLALACAAALGSALVAAVLPARSAGRLAGTGLH